MTTFACQRTWLDFSPSQRPLFRAYSFCYGIFWHATTAKVWTLSLYLPYDNYHNALSATERLW